jgi:hypothetical protein
MNNTKDPLFEALDRLARAVDNEPFGDPMPGITRKARANRRRVAALTVGGVAAVAVAGVAAGAVIDFPDGTPEPEIAETPSVSQTSAPSPPTPSPNEPSMAEYDQARADVDGDGAADTIRVLVPEADAGAGTDESLVSDDVRLQIEFAAGAEVGLGFGQGLAPTIAGTPDLDGNGTAEVVLSFSGGDAAWLKVFTWDGETVVPAQPANGSPADLVDDGGLYTEAETVSSALVDRGLISWVPTGDFSDPFVVKVWTWQLDGAQLVATEADQLQCIMSPGQFPEPC